MGKEDIDCGNVEVDHSCVIVQSEATSITSFQTQSLACDKCDLITSEILHHGEAKNTTLNFVSFGTKWRVVDENDDIICRQRTTYFDDGGIYRLFFNNTDCTLSQEKQGPSLILPIIIASVVFFLLAMLYIGCASLYRRKVWNKLLQSRGSLDELAASYSGSSCIEEAKNRQAKKRLKSLDTVRGISIAIMIFVNYGGGKYSFFHHAYWNGLTVADIVFPWFIWMMGMSLALSMRSLLRKSVPKKEIFFKICKRSVILLALGLMLNTLNLDVDLTTLRLSGVLQRFSISYFIVATVHLFFAQVEDSDQNSNFALFHDIFIYWKEWMVVSTFLLAHFLLTFLVHAPDCKRGYLGPGGLHDGGNYSSCTGGAAGYIDRLILGENHLYQRSTIKQLYHTSQPYDPEGLLGYLTSIFLVYLGLQAGKILLTYQSSSTRIFYWLAWAVVTGIMAAILSEVAFIPVNKNLWSVSYIFATGSLAFFLMAICYLVIDEKKWWNGAPFFYAGMNSILLYVGHSVMHKTFPWSWSVASNHADILAMNLWGTSLWVIISIYAYHIGFFITV